jgi:hypothetical protein
MNVTTNNIPTVVAVAHLLMSSKRRVKLKRKREENKQDKQEDKQEDKKEAKKEAKKDTSKRVKRSPRTPGLANAIQAMQTIRRARAKLKKLEESHRLFLDEWVDDHIIANVDSLESFLAGSFGMNRPKFNVAVPCPLDICGEMPCHHLTWVAKKPPSHSFEAVYPKPIGEALLKSLRNEFEASPVFSYLFLSHLPPEAKRRKEELVQTWIENNSLDLKNVRSGAMSKHSKPWFTQTKEEVYRKFFPDWLQGAIARYKKTSTFMGEKLRHEKRWRLFFTLLLLRTETMMKVYRHKRSSRIKTSVPLSSTFAEHDPKKQWSYDSASELLCNWTESYGEVKGCRFLWQEGSSEWRQGASRSFVRASDSTDICILSSPLSPSISTLIKRNHDWWDAACYFREIVLSLKLCLLNELVGHCLEYLFSEEKELWSL